MASIEALTYYADLRQRLNAALAAILADGTYAEINARYFPFSIY